jgi:hypothetical protein
MWAQIPPLALFLLIGNELKEVIMPNDKEVYFNKLSKDELSLSTINPIIEFIQKQGLHISPIPPDLLKKNIYGEKITEHLTRLQLYLVEGNQSWKGLLVGFPGNREELLTKSVGTPYLRKILYPILDLHHRLLPSYPDNNLPCIYFVGDRFTDVVIRKFDLLREVIPNIVVLTHDIYECSKNKSQPPKTKKDQRAEAWTQVKLSQKMYSKEGLIIPTIKKKITAKFLSYEIPCNEGTENPERLDILGYDESDHGLIAFELKGPAADRVELENLFLQGLEHRNWIEKNKMTIKLLFDGGPRGKR